MDGYMLLCIRYRLLVDEQRFCFSIIRASLIRETYSKMEALAYV